MPLTENDYTEELTKRLLSNYGGGDEVEEEVADETESQETSHSEPTGETKDAPAGIKDVLASEGFDLSELDDEDVAKQIAAKLKENSELERKLKEAEEAALRMQLELQKKQEEAQKPKEEAKPETPKEALRRWQKVEYDAELENLVERDPRTGMFRGKEKFLDLGHRAAEKLNAAAREQKRRAELMLSDPVAALEEAGYDDKIQSLIESKLTSWKSEWEKTQEDRAKAEAAKYEEYRQKKEFDDFYAAHEKELFKTDANGKLVLGLDSKPIPTEFGKMVDKEIEELRQEGITDFKVAVKLAYKTASKIRESVKTPEKTDKKQEFLAKGRSTSSNSTKQAPRASVAQVEGSQEAPRRFRDALLTDPDNAEILGTLYRGQ